jgi:hypothetical protein
MALHLFRLLERLFHRVLLIWSRIVAILSREVDSEARKVRVYPPGMAALSTLGLHLESSSTKIAT